MNYLKSKQWLCLLCAFIALIIFSNFNINDKAAPSRIGYVNVDQLLSQIPEYMQNQGKLDTLVNSLNAQLRIKLNEYNAKQEAFVRDSASLHTIVKEDRRDELKNLSSRIQAYQQRSSEEVQKFNTEKLQPISERLEETINNIAETHGYTHIIKQEVGAGNGLFLYAEDDSDLTAVVLESYLKNME